MKIKLAIASSLFTLLALSSSYAAANSWEDLLNSIRYQQMICKMNGTC